MMGRKLGAKQNAKVRERNLECAEEMTGDEAMREGAKEPRASEG